MKVIIKSYEVFIGADLGADNFTINIPNLNFFKTYNIKKNPITVLEQKANEIINQKELENNRQ